MNRLRPLVLLVAVGLAGFLVWRLWPRGGDGGLSGYIEGDLLYLSAPAAGAVSALSVEKGQRVQAGAPLFQIDPRLSMAATDQAAAALQAAEAAARDAQKGQRPAELAVIQAQRNEVRARLRQAKVQYERIRVLAARGIYAPARLDQARADYEAAEASAAEVERRLDVAELGQREDQVAAAQARAAQAAGGVSEAAVRLDLMSPRAPVAGRVQDVFFQKGEWAPANQPVVALLPDDRVKIRFYVAEGAVARYRPGRTIRFRCDGCGGPRKARISFVSPTAEYTPPVIYSRESRDKLVFLVEAVPEQPRALTPGLPVDVERLR
jgi:HlyD family secretion protein